MKDDYARYTLRIDKNLLGKLAYVARRNGRTSNKEIEQLIKKKVYDFERKNGKIDLAKTDADETME